MKIRDAFSYSFGAIRLRKLRAGLTILGVVIGIAAIAALLSITQGLQNTITTQLQEDCRRHACGHTWGGFFSGNQDRGGGFGPGMGGPNSGFQLQVNDTEIIEDLSPDILMASATIQSKDT